MIPVKVPSYTDFQVNDMSHPLKLHEHFT